MMKKLGMALLIALMVMTPVSQPMAATGINAHEQAILDLLSQPINLNGRSVSVPTAQINQVRNFLMNNDTSLTSAESASIIAQINSAIALAENSGYEALSEMSPAIVSQIVSAAETAASVIGLTIVADLSNGLGSVLVVDANGNVVGGATITPGGVGTIPVTPTPDGDTGTETPTTPAPTPGGDGPIRDTGFGATATIIVMGSLIGALGACGVVAKKQGMFSLTN